jgi:hypothetical protein
MKPSILKVISCFVIVSLISGCATSSRYVEAPTPPPSDMGIASRDNNISVTLNYLILPNGQGAWIKDARWDEYVVTVRNISDKPVTVEKIRLIDPRGLYIDGGVDPSQLETMSEALAKEYKDMGIQFAASTAIPVAVAAGVVGIGAMVLAPVALIGGGIWYLGKKHADIKDSENINKEFNRRRLATFTLANNATITGSAFFPMIPNPKALVVDCRIGSEMRVIEVSLEKLTGLHVASAKGIKEEEKK